jgi:hypothetical protein
MMMDLKVPTWTLYMHSGGLKNWLDFYRAFI